MSSDERAEITEEATTGPVQEASRRMADLRERRRARLISLMNREGLDVLLLGRGSNIEYATGCRDLTARPHPWSPRAALIAATGRVHVMSFLDAGDEGVPPELDPNNLFRGSPNPLVALAHLQAVAEISGSPTIGVDGFSVALSPLMQEVFPHDRFVPAEALLREARRKKLPEEIAYLREAAAVASDTLTAARAALRPGVSERDVQAHMLTHMTRRGATLFSHMGTVTVIEPGQPVRWISGNRTISAGSLVLAATGVLWQGYEGRIARTWVCGQQAAAKVAHDRLERRWRTVMEAVVEECRPGRTGLDLLRAYAATGERLPNVSIVRSIGLGDEGPIADPGWSPEWASSQELTDDMALVVRAVVHADAGTFVGEDMVHVSNDGPARLTLAAPDGELRGSAS